MQSPFPLWLAIEALSPQSAAKINPKHETSPVYAVDDGHPGLPWLEGHQHRQRKLVSTREWSYTVQGGIHNVMLLTRKIQDALQVRHREVYDKRKVVAVRVYDLPIDVHGVPSVEDLRLSMGVWVGARICREPKGLTWLSDIKPEFEAFEQALKDALKAFIANERPPGEDPEIERPAVVVTPERLDTITGIVFEHLGFPAEVASALFHDKAHASSNGLAYRIACFSKRKPPSAPAEPVIPKAPVSGHEDPTGGAAENRPPPKSLESRPAPRGQQQTDLLNSFFIRDLAMLSDLDRKHLGPALQQFVYGATEANPRRHDVSVPAERQWILTEILHPDRFPVGRWSSKHPLVYGQQVAINGLWARLQNAPGLFSVNGPPGTRKTTMLRDLIAAVVVERARKLAALPQPQDAFAPERIIKIDDKARKIRALAEGLKGYGMLVASANNGPVENITLEIPAADSVFRSGAQPVDYLGGIATRLINAPAWGLIAGKLGNQENRRDFTQFFFGWKDPATNEVLCPGFTTWLQTNKHGGLAHWNAARKRFEQALDSERSARANAVAQWESCAGQLRRAQALAREITADTSSLHDLEGKQAQFEVHFQSAKQAAAAATTALSAAQSNALEARERFTDWKESRPGFMESLFRPGKQRSWHDEYQTRLAAKESAAAQEKLAKSGSNTAARDLATAEQNLGTATAATAAKARRIKELKARRAKMLEAADKALSQPALAWVRADDSVREQSSPWDDELWRNARSEVFWAAMDLHLALFSTCSAEMRSAIGGLVVPWLDGQLPADLHDDAFHALTLLVPVISSTFASVSTFLRHVGKESIGWLLIDEAGQATPQSPAGALWRSRRAVVVGDPLQLKPIVALPVELEAAIGARLRVPDCWWATWHSAQELADAANPLGTYLPGIVKALGPDGDVIRKTQRIWIGSPLRVHRRCDNPMFSISNKVAYEEAMIHGKAPTAEQEPIASCPPSGWIDVRDTMVEDHWIPAEGRALHALLDRLLDEIKVPRSEVFLVSPFRSVADQLESIGKERSLDVDNRVGTVHTAQGKEADVTVLVLGGANSGARGWAAEEPNLLNVAASRAKKRLYVIGNRANWERLPHFGIAAAHLPALEIG